MAQRLMCFLAGLLLLSTTAHAAAKQSGVGDVLGGLAWMGGFVAICYLIVLGLRRLGSKPKGQWDGPQGDEMVRLGTSISRPIDER